MEYKIKNKKRNEIENEREIIICIQIGIKCCNCMQSENTKIEKTKRIFLLFFMEFNKHKYILNNNQYNNN